MPRRPTQFRFSTIASLIAALSLLSACAGPAEDGDSAASAVAENVTVLDDGTEFIVRTIREGTGDAAKAGDTVTVHYTGWLYEPGAPGNRGVKFDSSRDRGMPFRFPLGAGRVIAGWDMGVEGMRVGERRELIIPPSLGYGSRGAGNAIPPGATLYFEVELLAIN